ncbi:MAG TPA: DUF4203 domain-containing protein [Gordonia sp. (in: high G+C Gram-positive bacteria)]|uniref:TM7S3/TM198-like domain-containing protein n=1 Tax=unclassified Gordonia (in: high G+C Gram-positive bacteria) TaxID=2657482 RepID=UPI000F9E5E5D|nr:MULTISPECIES: DUF4203 domain-containing protein [unclassified Gordonia (in: high G+C Gram-positive bacteria)]RUP40684.1 MAG: DUF4203 domain-containing protein [Gordonia sp. (in: high G+C Gram-positive bacteria)]HNP57530.1 DUF4203 domain-containing protein [Gordonia sp. (in: high G+C Gram-positive bacteria)]HRC51085.1 DUF4203 domain-containing protein [Gordonia sp. (in: high G+C Gram-positive bacteria)]
MDILVGIIAIIVGALFCFQGIVAMRLVIALWGLFVGFNFGAGLVSAITGDGFLSTVLGWVIGIICALLFGLFAYLYYAVAVVIAMASVGFLIGSAVMVALNVSWNWVIILVGVIVGVLLAALAIAVNLPTIILIVISALGGATAIVGGLMFLFGQLNVSEFTVGSVTATIDESWWLWVLYIVLAVLGIVSQAREVSNDRDMSEEW